MEVLKVILAILFHSFALGLSFQKQRLRFSGVSIGLKCQNTPSQGWRRDTLNTIRHESANKSRHLLTKFDTHSCQTCQESFSSRNALFRHIRCTHTENQSLDKKQARTMYSMAFLVGYHDNKENSSDSEDLSLNMMSNKVVRDAFLSTIQSELWSDNNIEFTSLTHSTQAKSRHSTLSQDYSCYSAGDVMVVCYKSPIKLGSSFATAIKQYVEKNCRQDLNISILSAVNIPDQTVLHAERSCTQLIYHYALPLQWLPQYEEVEEWWKRKLLAPRHIKNFAAPTTITRLKKALKTAEGRKLSGAQKESTDSPKMSKGRYGLLADNEMKAWHNFADPSLMGLASPNHEPVWRALDRARISDFITRRDIYGDSNEVVGNPDEVFAIIEFRGDAFLPQQIRRIIGTVVGILHDQLPENFIDIATRPDVLIETPIAPKGLMYIASSRFHFFELVNRGDVFTPLHDNKSMHDCLLHGSSGAKDIRQDWITQMLQLMIGCSITRADSPWLMELQENVCPRIRRRLEYLESQSTFRSETTGVSKDDNNVPVAYTKTLQLLRAIVSEGKWPSTSLARAKVMTTASADVGKAGSFTVTNPEIKDEAISSPPPIGNTLFPDLASAVFELEHELRKEEGNSVESSRPPSSHCAINCNAEFTPHVDSGRGAGQSVSMIVGLGDYSGGDLFVEGSSHNIRYMPLEFDGWKMRHWTAPFNGERFSLVWFTPAPK